MANRLKMATVNSIQTLHNRDWSQRRVAWELAASRRGKPGRDERPLHTAKVLEHDEIALAADTLVRPVLEAGAGAAVVRPLLRRRVGRLLARIRNA